MKPGGKGAGVEKGGEETPQGSPESNKNMAPFLFGTKRQQEDYLFNGMWEGTHRHAHRHTADRTQDPKHVYTHTHTHGCTPKWESVAFMPLVKCCCRKDWFGCGATRQETSCPSSQKPAHKNAILQGPVPGLVLGKYVLAFAQLLP